LPSYVPPLRLAMLDFSGQRRQVARGYVAGVRAAAL
jgi:hypothetical protein